ncbi:hypothetical protein [Flavobacterium macrobrachii]|uniref:MetA-pathway of phenol degradation n=1 Tax=Flavobacterium macrobrachii TaxID=591204 RepID=A0ABS2D194_9FLAO|nr:hypothetical protein [Flavobacterium macrobrachii]MBM6500232.1 hypothetical protein [Flavobacterium macrobrachii]
MKRVVFYLLVLFVQWTYGQQNLFNIPSGDITKEGKIFYQHQLNVYSEKIESKGHFVYGLGKGWDAGINLVGKGAYFSDDWRLAYNSDTRFGSVYPNLMGTLQKQFKINDKLDFNIGTQIGVNLSTKLENKELNNFNYAIFTKHIGKGSRIVAGAYHGNRMFLGTGNDTGILLGYEMKLNKRWYLMGDWVSGSNNEGVAVLGGMYNLSKRVQLCAGWLLPNENNPKPQGVVLEINILTWDLF